MPWNSSHGCMLTRASPSRPITGHTACMGLGNNGPEPAENQAPKARESPLESLLESLRPAREPACPRAYAQRDSLDLSPSLTLIRQVGRAAGLKFL